MEKSEVWKGISKKQHRVDSAGYTRPGVKQNVTSPQGRSTSPDAKGPTMRNRLPHEGPPRALAPLRTPLTAEGGMVTENPSEEQDTERLTGGTNPGHQAVSLDARQTVSLIRATLRKVNYFAGALQKDTTVLPSHENNKNKKMQGAQSPNQSENNEEQSSLNEILMSEISRLQGLLQNCEKDNIRINSVLTGLKRESEIQKKRIQDLLAVIELNEKEIKTLRAGQSKDLAAVMTLNKDDRVHDEPVKPSVVLPAKSPQTTDVVSRAQYSRGHPLPRFHVRLDKEGPSVDSVTLVLLQMQNAKYLHQSEPETMLIVDRFMNNVIQASIRHHNGYVADMFHGDYFIAFIDPVSACAFALEVQNNMMDELWPETLDNLADTKRVLSEVDKDNPNPQRPFLWAGPRLRMAIHQCHGDIESFIEPCAMNSTYVGHGCRVVRTALDSAYGGMIALSVAVRDSVMNSFSELGQPFVAPHRVVELGTGQTDMLSTDERIFEVFRMFPRSLSDRECDIFQWETTAKDKLLLQNRQISVGHHVGNEEESPLNGSITSCHTGGLLSTSGDCSPECMKTFLSMVIEGAEKVRTLTGCQGVIPRYMSIVVSILDYFGQTHYMCSADRFLITFDSPVTAVRVAMEVQERLAVEEWPTVLTSYDAFGTVLWKGNTMFSGLRCKAALHTCAVRETDGAFGPTYRGPEACVAAWLCSQQARAGDIILSASTYSAVYPELCNCCEPYVKQIGAVQIEDSTSTTYIFQLVPQSLIGRLFIAEQMNDTDMQRSNAECSLKRRITTTLERLYQPKVDPGLYERILACITLCFKDAPHRRIQSILPSAESVALERFDDVSLAHICPTARTVSLTLDDLGAFAARYSLIHNMEATTMWEKEIASLRQSLLVFHSKMRNFTQMVLKLLNEPSTKVDEEVFVSMVRWFTELETKDQQQRLRARSAENPSGSGIWDYILTQAAEDEKTLETDSPEAVIRSSLAHCGRLFVKISSLMRSQLRMFALTAKNQKSEARESTTMRETVLAVMRQEEVSAAKGKPKGLLPEDRASQMTDDVRGMLAFVEGKGSKNEKRRASISSRSSASTPKSSLKNVTKHKSRFESTSSNPQQDP